MYTLSIVLHVYACMHGVQDQGVRYICAGVAEQQEGLFVLNLSSNGISSDGAHHISAMLVRHHENLNSVMCGTQCEPSLAT